MNITLLIDNRQDNIEITDDYKKVLEETIKVCLENEDLKADYEVSMSFVTNQEIHDLNKTYRNVDSPTDVLSFPLYEGDEVFVEDKIFMEDKILVGGDNLSLENECVNVCDKCNRPLLETSIMLGDVIISTEKVIDQAKEFGHSLEREMLYLVTHSILHLLGYDHIEEQGKIIMRQHEKDIMKKLQLFK